MSEACLAYNATVIVTSDTCHQDNKLDTSGKYVSECLSEHFRKVEKVIVPDEKSVISNSIKSALKNTETALIITVGGTGLCPRDVTPESSSVLYDRECPGIQLALMLNSLRYNSCAALSRLTAGVIGNCLIVNFPGSLKACKECFSCLKGFLEHAIEQIRFDPITIGTSHVRSDEENSGEELSKRVDKSLKVTDTDVSLGSVINPLSSGHSTGGDGVPELETIHKAIEIESSHVSDGAVDPGFFNMNPSVVSQKIENRPINTSSPYKMLSYEEALTILDQYTRSLRLDKERIRLDTMKDAQDAIGYLTATEVQALSPVPPFLTSTMDGYLVHIPKIFRDKLNSIQTVSAFLATDFEQLQSLRESDKSSRFFCCQVNTGGRVPDADLVVVPFENTETVKSDISIVRIKKMEPGRYIRQPGSDLTTSDKIEAGTRLTPVIIGLIQSMGHRTIEILRKPRIGILSNGDELVDVSQCEPKTVEKVVDINRTVLATFYGSKHFEVVDCGISGDSANEILLRVKSGLNVCDVLVITGGASMGTKDYVKDVIHALGGEIHFGRVNIKPGKPVAFATISQMGKEKFIFSLPGNPVSAYITSMAFVTPFIEHGMMNHFRESSRLTLSDIGDLVLVRVRNLLDGNDIDSVYTFDGRLEFVRANLIEKEKSGSVFPVDISIKQQSSRMISLKGCNCLIIVDPSWKGSRFLEGQIYHALRLKS